VEGVAVATTNRKPRITVETSTGKEIPKLKTDDKQLRQAVNVPVVNNSSPGILELIDDNGNRVLYTPNTEVGTKFITLNNS
jgi:hypothetical protein